MNNPEPVKFENETDVEADASSQDELVELTDNRPTEDDGDQSDVSQEPIQEGDVE